MKILIVEDDFINIKVIKHLADKYGDTDLALDGNEAVETVTKEVEAGSHFDLILLDIMMPEKDGIAALKEIRELEHKHGLFHGSDGKGAKIIMVTASNDRKNFLNAFKEQCDGYIQKPVTPDKFEDALKKVDLI
ncbi:MAG: response regulator [Fibrobacterales bacterium]